MKQELGMTEDGSLSTALSNFVFEKLGLNSFMKETPCDRSEPPYSINKLNYTGWSSGIQKNINEITYYMMNFHVVYFIYFLCMLDEIEL